MTQSHTETRYGSFTRETRDITLHTHTRHGSFVYRQDMTQSYTETRHDLFIRHMARANVFHDSFTRETRDMTPSYTYTTWLIRIQTRHDSIIHRDDMNHSYATGLVYMCAMPYLDV